MDKLNLYLNLESHEEFVELVNSYTSIDHILAMYDGRSKFELPTKFCRQDRVLECWGGYEYKTSSKSGHISTPSFGQKYSKDLFIRQETFKYIIEINEKQTLDIHLQIDLKEGDEEVYIGNINHLGFTNRVHEFKKSGNYTVRNISDFRSVICFLRMIDYESFDVWNEKGITGMKLRWAVNGEFEKVIHYDNANLTSMALAI